MKHLIRTCVALSMLLWCGMAFAQTHIITGNIKDEKGMALPYITVQVKGTTIGAYTDTAGNFSLAVDSSSKTLVISFPGMRTQEVPISNNMMITMKSDALG